MTLSKRPVPCRGVELLPLEANHPWLSGEKLCVIWYGIADRCEAVQQIKHSPRT